MIKIKNINKYYNKGKRNEIKVIDGTSLSLPDTGLITFFGRSGSGKTTLLNVIGGIDKAKGIIDYDDNEYKLSQRSKIDKYRKKNIGYVFQNYDLLLNMSVYDNLKLALELIGIVEENEVNKRVDYCLKAVGLYKYKKRSAAALSGGQQQRVSIARALVKNSKIIIADEPTGNLDSANSIEILNILKKVSQTRLVLLVTHDLELAEFYSDRIIKINDGVVNEDKENIPTSELSNKDNRSIYLKDLKKSVNDNGDITLNIFKDNEETQTLEMDVYYNKGTIFLKVPNNVKIIGVNSEVELKNEHYKAITKESLEDFEFDTDNFVDTTVNHRKKRFLSLMKSFKTSVSKMFYSKFKTKLLHFGLLLVGVVLAIAVIMLSTASHIDKESLRFDSNLIVAKHRNMDLVSENILKDDNITNVVTNYQYIALSIEYNAASSSRGMFSGYRPRQVYILNINDYKNIKVLTGSLPTKSDEFVITLAIFNSLQLQYKDKYNLNMTNILNKTIISNNMSFKITGIVDSSSTSIYGNTEAVMMATSIIKNRKTDPLYGKEVDYEIVSGSDLDYTSSDNQVILPITYLTAENNYPIGGIVGYPGADSSVVNYTVVGFFKGGYQLPLLNKKIIYSSNDKIKEVSIFPYSDFDITLSSGRLPNKEGEVVVFAEANAAIDSKVRAINNAGSSIPQTVVGIIDKVKGLDASTKILDIGFSVQKDCLKVKLLGVQSGVLSTNTVLIETKDKKKTTAKLESYGIDVQDSESYANAFARKEAATQVKTQIVVIIVLFSIIIVYVYFMMRARMINKIYSIGVYRALGASKRQIYGMFIADLLVITTFTTLLGYLIVTYVFTKITAPLVEMSQIFSQFGLSSTYLLLGIVFMYVINISFGLLPIIMLLRKTPAQIKSKYDI